MIAQIALVPGRKDSREMTEREAKAYIAVLTYEEKLRLNELLKALEQKRQPSPTPPQTNCKDE